MTFLRYPGGKSKAAQIILSRFPKKIVEYREPMVGGGSIFLAAKKNNIAQRYWVNDLFADLINLWRVMSDENQMRVVEATLYELHSKWQTVNERRGLFNYAKSNLYCSKPTKRAILFFIINRCSYSGTTLKGGFSASSSQDRFTRSSIERLYLSAIKVDRQVKITCLDYRELLKARGKNVFIYLDPPYIGHDGLYTHEAFDHEKLSHELRSTEHNWLLSLNDCDETRRLYGGWSCITEHEWAYGSSNVNAETSRVGKELLISNYVSKLRQERP